MVNEFRNGIERDPGGGLDGRLIVADAFLEQPMKFLPDVHRTGVVLAFLGIGIEFLEVGRELGLGRIVGSQPIDLLLGVIVEAGGESQNLLGLLDLRLPGHPCEGC